METRTKQNHSSEPEGRLAGLLSLLSVLLAVAIIGVIIYHVATLFLYVPKPCVDAIFSEAPCLRLPPIISPALLFRLSLLLSFLSAAKFALTALAYKANRQYRTDFVQALIFSSAAALFGLPSLLILIG